MFHLVGCSNLLVHFPVGVLHQTTFLLLSLRYFSKCRLFIHNSISSLLIEILSMSFLWSFFESSLWCSTRISRLWNFFYMITLPSKYNYCCKRNWPVNSFVDEGMIESYIANRISNRSVYDLTWYWTFLSLKFIFNYDLILDFF